MPRHAGVRSVAIRRAFALLRVLGDGRPHKLRAVARQLQISTRTVRREILALIESGIPIESRRVDGGNDRDVTAYYIRDRKQAEAAVWGTSAPVS
jgi:predicted DNA-binding transcriptional regulator YafY